MRSRFVTGTPGNASWYPSAVPPEGAKAPRKPERTPDRDSRAGRRGPLDGGLRHGRMARGGQAARPRSRGSPMNLLARPLRAQTTNLGFLVLALVAGISSPSSAQVRSEHKIAGSQGGFSGILQSKQLFGIDIEPIGDLDGDGVGDLAVGARGYYQGVSTGAVWILFMTATGTVRDQRRITGADPVSRPPWRRPTASATTSRSWATSTATVRSSSRWGRPGTTTAARTGEPCTC